MGKETASGPQYEPRLYIELSRDWALYMVQRGLADPSDRPCVVDVTRRIAAGRWRTLSAGSRLLDDVRGWTDGAISREGGVISMWVDGLPYTAFKRFVLVSEAA